MSIKIENLPEVKPEQSIDLTVDEAISISGGSLLLDQVDFIKQLDEYRKLEEYNKTHFGPTKEEIENPRILF